MNSLKRQLYEECLGQVQERLKFLIDAIRDIQLSANEETKSSAGDKYETARAMAQSEVGRLQVQLAEALKMKEALTRISSDDDSYVIKPGSLIFTTRGNFYLTVNAGQFNISGQTFITVSPASPIGQKLIGLDVQSTFIHNKHEFIILKIQ